MAENKVPAINPRWAWERYQPSNDAPWDVKRVGHLYRRAGFGPTQAELDAGLRDGPDRTIDRLLSGQSEPDTAFLARSISQANNGARLPAYWLFRMLYTPHPLREKMTLFWHNHFATSNAKVNNAGYMLGQYDLMRTHALGSFRTLLQEMSRDPAMLVWLDTIQSRREMPNENYARELMELFSLGVRNARRPSERNYTEDDIREAARAFTGWTLEGGRAIFRREQHDDTEKNVLGRRGRWQGSDIVNICLDQESAPYFIAAKLYRFLISESVPATPEILAPLADQFRASDYNFGALVETVLRSNLFFSPLVYRTKVKSPVEFALGIVRGLEGHQPEGGRGIGTVELASALEGLGQRLFYPPNVAGWEAGRSWLNGTTYLVRQNLALALTSTTDDRFGRRTDPARLTRQQNRLGDPELVQLFLRLFLQDDVPAESRGRLLQYLEQARTQTVPVFWSQEDAANQRVRALCHLVLCLPEYQLN